MRYESIDAYYDIKPLLSKMREKVLLCVLNNGPCTGRQINKILNSQSAHKRLSELERLGLIEPGGCGKCPITGQESTLWVAVPSERVDPKAKLPPPKHSRSQLQAELLKAEFVNTRLKRRIASLESVLLSQGITVDEHGDVISIRGLQSQIALPMEA